MTGREFDRGSLGTLDDLPCDFGSRHLHGRWRAHGAVVWVLQQQQQQAERLAEVTSMMWMTMIPLLP